MPGLSPSCALFRHVISLGKKFTHIAPHLRFFTSYVNDITCDKNKIIIIIEGTGNVVSQIHVYLSSRPSVWSILRFIGNLLFSYRGLEFDKTTIVQLVKLGIID